MMRLLAILLLPLLAGAGQSAEVLVVDGSASIARRDPGGLTAAAARLLVLALARQTPLCIYGLDPGRRFLSPARNAPRELQAALAAVEEASGGAVETDLGGVLEEITREESFPGSPPHRLFLLTDGFPSLTLEDWDRRYGLGREELEADPLAWHRNTRRAHERRLTQVVTQLRSQGVALWWIAPLGRQPGSALAAEIVQGEGQVLAGRGPVDLEEMLEALLQDGKGGQALAFGPDMRRTWVPPAARTLEVLFAKPADALLRLTAPRDETYILGMGQAAGWEAIRLPPAGEWTAWGSAPGIAYLRARCELELALGDELESPGLVGHHRLGTVRLQGRDGQRLDLRPFEEIQVVLRAGRELHVLPRREDSWILELQLPGEGGVAEYQLEAVVRRGDWSATATRAIRIPVHDLALVVDLGGSPIPDGTPHRVTARILRDGEPWGGASVDASLDNLTGTRLPFHQVEERQELELPPLEAGEHEWVARADVQVPGGSLVVSTRGMVAVGRVQLELEGGATRSGWSGTLMARSSLTVPVAVEVKHQVTRPGPAGARQVLEEGRAELVVQGDEPGLQRLPVLVEAPRKAGRYQVVLEATVLETAGLGSTRLQGELVVRPWWQLLGWQWPATGLGTLLLVSLLLVVLWRRPHLQGELELEDREGRSCGDAIQPGAGRGPLGRRSVTVGTVGAVDHLVPQDPVVGGWQIRLVPRSGDLGLVWTVVRNEGHTAVVVAEEPLAPGDRRLLQHDDLILAGDLGLRYRHPMLAGLSYAARL